MTQMRFTLFIILITFSFSCNHHPPVSKGVKSFSPLTKKRAQKLFDRKTYCWGTPDLSEINNNQVFNYDKKESNIWFHSIRNKKKGVFLILHGLNLKPTKMNSLSHFWSSRGYDVLRGTLAGHFGDKEEMKLVTRELWRRNTKHLFCHALTRARKLDVPLYFLGYSLGAAVMLDFISNVAKHNPYDKLILLAPAVRVKWYAHLPKYLAFFSTKIMVPSENLTDYRSQDGTSTAAYLALHEIIENIEPPFKHFKGPARVYLDPDDELISRSGLEKVIKDGELNNWNLQLITKSEKKMTKNYAHLIIDPLVLGEKSWNLLTDNMTHFIEGSSLTTD